MLFLRTAGLLRLFLSRCHSVAERRDLLFYPRSPQLSDFPVRVVANRIAHRRSTLFIVAILLMAPAAHAQGCTQCRDNTAATPPSTQRAYRRAIGLLALTAGGIFVGTVTLLRRSR